METQTKEFNLSAYAHLGDAVYEVFVREKIIKLTSKPQKMHKLTTDFVCATTQARFLQEMSDFFTEDEKEILRRARNLPLTQNKKNNQAIHRQATAFEVIIGFFYLHNNERLRQFFECLGQKFNEY